MMFSCTDEDFDKNYTPVDAGLGVNAALTFDANAGTQEVTFATVPEGSIWGYRKSNDWISVAQFNNRLVISVPLYEGLTEVDGKLKLTDREGTVTLVKEAAGGVNVEAGSIKVTQTCAVPGATNWDSGAIPYTWNWNEKDTVTVSFANPNVWSETGTDNDGKPYYKYVYKINGAGASNFVQTVNDSVRPVRTIKIANKDDNNAREENVVAYFIVTDKDGTKIYARRTLTVEYREGNFTLNTDKVTVSADKTEVEVEAIPLNADADKLKCKLIGLENYDWITLPTEVNTGKDKFVITVAANSDTAAGREAVIELVSESGASFNPPVYLTIRQNQKPEF
jgi:hypothetical protein